MNLTGIQKRKLSKCIKYRFQLSYKGIKYSSPSIYDNPIQAEIAKREKLIEMELTHSTPNTKPISLGELAILRIQDLTIKRSKSYTYNSERYLQHMVDVLGHNTSILTITKPVIVKYLNELAQRMLASKVGLHQVNQTLATLKSFFNYCIEDLGILQNNPCIGIKQYRVNHKEKYIPPDSHIYRVREQLNTDQRNLIDFLIQTGSRISSALGLTVDNIKWPDKRMALYTSKSRHGDHSYYIVPIAQVLIDMHRNGSLPSHGRVFHQWKSGTNPHFLFRTIKKINEKNIESEYGSEHIPVFSYHALRHRACTLWIKRGLSLRECQLRLGHASYSMTERYINKLLGTQFTHYTDALFDEW